MDDIVERNLYVNMERDHLDGIPDHALPEGFGVRWYEPGDERFWVRIHQEAEVHVDVTEEVFQRVFGSDLLALPARQAFLMNDRQEPIATATAWYEEDFHGRPYGRVHWVAVVPRYQGQGLSKPLMTIVLNRMVELGHTCVFLRTSTARLPAIRLYQQYGFRPSLRSEEDRTIWQQLNSRLPEPFTL